MPARRRPVSIRRDDVIYDNEYDGSRRWWSERADDEARVQKELAKRRAKGESLRAAVPVHSRTLSATFWGQAWNRNLMAYSDYENRMPRGRSYFRSGKVLDLDIGKGKVSSTVAGTRIYEIEITIKPLARAAWENLKRRCQGKIGGLVELLSGALSDEVMQEVTDLDRGLFPSPREMRLDCSCPDYAGLCKHLAATLYAVGSRLDEQPALLFALRGVDPGEMVAGNAVEAIQHLTAPAAVNDARAAALEGIDFSDVFGIDGEGGAFSAPAIPAPAAKPVARKTGKKTKSGK